MLFSNSIEKRHELDTYQKYTFLALGDSYTIGEAVSENERWPMQLSDRLLKDSIRLKPTIMAATGWTTDELMSEIEKSNIRGPYDLVSLLVGVNNQYRGYSEKQFEAEFKALLDQAIGFAGGNNHHVFVVSIPDYGVTPFVRKKDLNAERVKYELDRYNAIAQKIATLREVSFMNITPISRKAGNSPELTAADGLHPSGKMYGMWVDHIYTQVYNSLSSG